jgi:hypothetical protein
MEDIESRILPHQKRLRWCEVRSSLIGFELIVSSPTIEDVARLVAGADPPEWLIIFFKRWVPCLMLDRYVHNIQPTKAEIKKRLAEFRAAALILQRGLTDPSITAFLEVSPLGEIEGRIVLEQKLLEFADRAERAAALPELSTKAGKTKPGRNRALPPGTFPPKVYCAALIAETWKYFHGELPAPRNLTAAAAANALHLASGGQATGWGEDPRRGWQYYFKRVSEPAVATMRAEFRRHLNLTERWG